MPSAPDRSFILTALQKGEITLQGQFLRGSNYTFLGTLVHQELNLKVVYKPVRGEQPLWDFPTGSLANREVAAYWVSEKLGWELVPPTVLRKHAPLGKGSVQQYIEHDPQYHYFNFSEDDHERLRPVALFDVLCNNADRKGSHILLDEQKHIWLIDQGLCFNIEEKLRTVVWEFSGQEIPGNLLADLTRVQQDLESGGELALRLKPLLSKAELRALETRARRLLETAVFPPPGNQRPYPWPPV